MTGWLLVLGTAAVYDAYALKTGKTTLSTAAGRHPVLTTTATAALLIHFNSHRLRRLVK